MHPFIASSSFVMDWGIPQKSLALRCGVCRSILDYEGTTPSLVLGLRACLEEVCHWGVTWKNVSQSLAPFFTVCFMATKRSVSFLLKCSSAMPSCLEAN